MKQIGIKLCAIAALLVLSPDEAHAQLNCRLTIPPMDFGLYSPGTGAPHDVTGSVDIRCSGQTGTIVVTLAPGGSGSFSARSMTSGPFTMLYNLYRDAARTLVWGDGTGGSVVNSVVKPNNGRADFSMPVYGRIPPTQSVGAGAYQDSLLVTAIF